MGNHLPTTKKQTKTMQSKADFSVILSVLLSGISWTVGNLVEILSGLAAIIAACFAAYHYFHLAQLNIEKKRRSKNESPPSDFSD
jgi:hypothetical protein